MAPLVNTYWTIACLAEYLELKIPAKSEKAPGPKASPSLPVGVSKYTFSGISLPHSSR